MIRDPLTDADLAQLVETLAVALLLPADVVVTAPLGALPCINCGPGVDRAAVAVITWRRATYRAHLLRDPNCAHCLPREAQALAHFYPITIEIPAVIT